MAAFLPKREFAMSDDKDDDGVPKPPPNPEEPEQKS